MTLCTSANNSKEKGCSFLRHFTVVCALKTCFRFTLSPYIFWQFIFLSWRFACFTLRTTKTPVKERSSRLDLAISWNYRYDNPKTSTDEAQFSASLLQCCWLRASRPKTLAVLHCTSPWRCQVSHVQLLWSVCMGVDTRSFCRKIGQSLVCKGPLFWICSYSGKETLMQKKLYLVAKV